MVLFIEYYRVINEVAKSKDQSKIHAFIANGICNYNGTNTQRKRNIKMYCKFFAHRGWEHYEMNNEEMGKIFGKIYGEPDLVNELKKSKDIPVLMEGYYLSRQLHVQKRMISSCLRLEDIDTFLVKFHLSTNIDYRHRIIQSILEKMTNTDFKQFIRLLKNDLKPETVCIDVILQNVHANAYQTYMDVLHLDRVLDLYLPDTLMDIGCLATSQLLVEKVDYFSAALEKFPNGMMCEMDFGGVRVIYRNGYIHVDSSYPPHYRRVGQMAAKFTELIRRCLRTDNVVLEMEVVAINWQGTYVPLCNMTRLQIRDLDPGSIFIIVVDCMYCGYDIANKPFIERRAILREFFAQDPHIAMWSSILEVHSMNDMRDLIGSLMFYKLRAVRLKDMNAPYRYNKTVSLYLSLEALLTTKGYTILLAPIASFPAVEIDGKWMTTFLLACHNKETNRYRALIRLYQGSPPTFNEALALRKLVNSFVRSEVPPSWFDPTDCAIVPPLFARNPKEVPIWEVYCVPLRFEDGTEHKFIHHTYVAEELKPEFPTDLSVVQELMKDALLSPKSRKLTEALPGTERVTAESVKRKADHLADTASRIKKEAKTEVKTEVKPGVKLEVKPEVKPEANTDVNMEEVKKE